MPDAKISDLPDGGDPQPTDDFVVARGATNNKLAWSSLSNAATHGNVALTIAGNTAGVGALISSGTINLAGGANVTLSQAGNAITISAGGGAETQTFIGGISASDTLYTSGTVRFTGSQAVTVRSGTGQLVVIDAPAQTTQTQGILSAGVSTGGNTAGNTTVNTGSRLVFVGAGDVSLNQATAAGASTISISGTQTVQTQDVLSIGVSTGGNTSGNTTVNTGSRFVIVGSNGITASQGTAAGATTVTLSGVTQSAQTQGIINAGVSTGGNTSGDTTVNTGTRLVFIGGNNVTLSQGTAANATSITISGPNVGGAQTGISGIANSQTTYTSGTVSLSELGAITIRSTTGNQFQFSVNSQTVQTQGILSAGVSTGGNTAGNTTVNTGSRLVFVGTNLVSLSEGTAAGASTITLDATNQNLSVGVSTGGNTAGNTTVNSGSRFVIVGSNGITASQGTAAGATTVTLSGITQSVQTQDVLSVGVSTGGNTAGNTTVNTGSRLVFVASGDLTASQATAAGATTVQLSAGTQSVQTQDVLSIGVSTGGNTAGNTTVNTGSRMVFVGSNLVSISEGTAAGASTLTFDASNQNLSIGVSTGGNTSGNTTVNSGSRFVIVGSNGITASQGTAAGATTLTLSGRDPGSVGMSTQGNTAGDTGFATQRLALVGSNNITLSGSTNGGSMTISINAPSPGAAQYSVGVSNLGNTAGSTGVTGTRIVFVGTNNISLSQSTDATGATISVNNTVSAFQAGVSTMGNTAGDTGVTGTRLVLAGSGAITMSQATGANGATITATVPATSSLSGTGNIQISTNGSTISVGDGGNVVNFWDNLVPGNSTTFVAPNATLLIYPLDPVNAVFPGYMNVSTIMLDLSGTVSTGAAFTRSFSIGFYTLVNSTSLALMASASTSFGTGAAAAGITNSYGGRRWLTLDRTQFNNPINFSAGSDYYVAIWDRSTSGSQTFSYQGQLLPYGTGARSGIIGAASSSNTTLGHYPFLGNYSVSFSTAMPANLAASDINKSNATAVSLPRLIFNNLGSNIV